MAILKQAESGVPVPQLCREQGMSSATFYKWRAKFGGMDASMMAKLKGLEDENRRLKKMYAEAQMSADILKEAMTKKGEAISAPRDGPMGGSEQRPKYPEGLLRFRHQRDVLSLPTQAV